MSVASSSGNSAKSLDNSGKSGIIISNDVINHSSIGEFTAYKNPKKPEKGGGNFSKGGHGQENIEELERRGIEYNIVQTYSNGVRVGNVPKHSEKGKRSGIGQSWFSENWTREDIRQAGIDVLKKKQVVLENKDGNGSVIAYTVFGEHKGVTVGIYTDKNGSLSGKNGTIFPDNLQRKIGDFNAEQK